MNEPLRKLINGAAWAGFMICALLTGAMISYTFRTGDYPSTMLWVLSSMGAIVSILISNYTKPRKENEAPDN